VKFQYIRDSSLSSWPIGSAGCAIDSANFGGVFDVERLSLRKEELEREATHPSFWEDRARAEAVLREKSAVEHDLSNLSELADLLEEASVLFELSSEAEDAQTQSEGIEKLKEAERRLDEAELTLLLGGEHDRANAIVSINSGEGGTDACDWAEMLLRMYLRWAERHGFKSEILDLQPAEEAGIRSATVLISGEHAYGYLSVESGVHRLVRISPFGSGQRRQTSFASVSVLPEIDDEIEIDIDEADLRVDTFRASGAGGQHVNKTSSAVRMTHIPTGIVVQCQSERSQHKNRSSALKVLKARLFERAEREKEAKVDALRGDQMNIGFGSQIRSYTLNPTQRIKDHRTNFEVGSVGPVLDGDVDRFIRAALLWRAGRREEEDKA